MPPLVRARKSVLELACCRYGVERLELFGSAAGGAFDAATSDLDFLVTFNAEARKKAFDNYFGLRERLEELFGRSVDLVTTGSLKNPVLIREIQKQRQLIYAA